MTFQQDPKRPKFWGGFNAIGAAGIRALHQVDDKLAPYLKKVNKDSVSYKRNGFDEVVSTGAVKPYLFGTYLIYDAELGLELIFETSCSPEDHLALPDVGGAAITVSGIIGSRNYSLFPYLAFVGDGYAARVVMSDGNFDMDTATWMVLHSIDGGAAGEYFPATGRRGQSISYIESSVNNLPPNYLSINVWATGWKDDASRYHFGLTTLVPQDTTDETTASMSRAPACLHGNTGDLQLTVAGFPSYVGRNHFEFYAFTTGRGKLQALVFADNMFYASGTPNPLLPYAAPYLAYSDDHGESWSTAAVAWLTPVLCPSGFDASTKRLQMEFMAKHATITYVGDGKTLLFIPNAYVSGPELTAVYAPAIFLGLGTSYTRLTWPPDTWQVPVTGIPDVFDLVFTNVVGFALTKETRAGHHGFGDGCFYVWVKESGVGKLLYTRDYGGSWAFAEVPPTFGKVAGAVITPYVSAEKPGRIIFAAPDYALNTLSFYSTTGEFAEFKNMGRVIKAKGDLIPDPNGQPYNYFFANYGGLRYRPYVFPAYPKEFEKP